MKNALGTKFTLTDDFQMSFTNNKRPLSAEGSGLGPQDILDLTCMSIQLPQLGSAVESVMMAGEWRVYNAKFQPFSFSITFRDFGSLDLRNYFSAVWMDAQRGYYDDVKSNIRVSINNLIVFESADCLITSVSQVDLNNASSQIAEFTVEFSSPYYSNHQIKEFGSDSYRNENNKTGNVNGAGQAITDLTGVDSILSPVRDIASSIGKFF